MRGLTIGLVYSYEPVSQLRRCVESLQKEIPSILPLVGSIEWILVRTPKAFLQDLSFFPGLVINSFDENLAHNRNLALDASTKEGFYFIDPDCWLQEGSLKKLCEAFLENKNDISIFAYAGPNILKTKNQKLEKFFDWLGRTRLLHGGLAQIEQPRKDHFDWHSPTCHILYRRNVLKDSHYSSVFRIVGEDLEFHFRQSQRLKRILICSQAFVWHEQSNDLRTYLKKTFRYGLAQTLLLKVRPRSYKNKRLLVLFGFLSWLTIFSALPFPLKLGWIVISMALALSALLVEIFFYEGERDFISFPSFYVMIVGSYLLGQISGLLWPVPRPENALPRAANNVSF